MIPSFPQSGAIDPATLLIYSSRPSVSIKSSSDLTKKERNVTSSLSDLQTLSRDGAKPRLGSGGGLDFSSTSTSPPLPFIPIAEDYTCSFSILKRGSSAISLFCLSRFRNQHAARPRVINVSGTVTSSQRNKAVFENCPSGDSVSWYLTTSVEKNAFLML